MTRKKAGSASVEAAFERMAVPVGSAPLLDRVQPKEVAAPVHTTKPLQQLTRQVLLQYIELDPHQVRESIDEEELTELADSIRQLGLLQYVTLQKLADSDRYRVVAGHRRVLASRKAGLEAIPAVIRPEGYAEQQRMLEQLVENTQRVNLTPIEEARRYQLLMDSFALSQPKLAKLISRPQARIAEHIGILRIPEDQLARAKDLPQRVLVEISKAPAAEIPSLIALALGSTGRLQQVKEHRVNRKAKPARPTYWHEEFTFDHNPPVEIRWKVDPEKAELKELVKVLTQVLAELTARARKRHRSK